MIKTDLKETCSSIITQGPDPLSLTGCFLQILMMHFSDPRNINQAALREYTWAKDDLANQIRKSNIVLTTVSKFDARDMYQRPAVVIKRKNTSANKDVIGGQYQGVKALPGEPGVDPNNHAIAGQNMFEYANKGSFQFVCIHKEGAAAEILGTEVFNLLLGWVPQLARELKLWDWLPLTLGELVKVEEAEEHWATVVSLEYAYRSRVIWRPESPLLKGIISSHNLA